MNEGVSTTGMQVKAQVPGGIQISPGKTSADYSLNDSNDYLVLKNDNTPDDPTDSDWASEIQIDKYYKFGKMIPASSTDGEHIYFTPDAISAGRNVKNEGRYFQADGKTDGYLQYYVENNTFPDSSIVLSDSDSLATTAHAFTQSEASNKENAWSNYRKKTSWNNTNDDGYYVDIPLWLKSSETNSVSLRVKGIVVKGPNTLTEPLSNSATEPLYKSIRVALLDGTSKTPLGVVVDEVTNNTSVTSILPLKPVSSFDDWSSGTSILDSYNYNTTRGTSNNNLPLFGVSRISSGTTAEYSLYEEYAAATTNIITLNGNEPSKIWIRVWLDGEDKGCWNPNAGQDWMISLKFEKVE